MLDPLTDPVTGLFTGEVDFSEASVWAHARQDYLAGEAAHRVCERYGLALSTFRERAKREGWRRTDQDAAPVEPRPLAEAPPTGEMAGEAWRAMADALRRGRAHEAHAFLRLMRELRTEAQREADRAAHEARQAENAARAAETAAKAATGDPVLDSLDSESVADSVLADLAPLEPEAERLSALARAGKASPRELLALGETRRTLKAARAACAAVRTVEAMAKGP